MWLVVPTHATSYDAVRRARLTLYGSRADILGTALKDVNVSNDGPGYGQYDYGYGYGLQDGASGGTTTE